MLFTPERHEPVTDSPFSEAGARSAIARIVARAEAELDRADGSWPLDPDDRETEDEESTAMLYHGASGIVWGLGELAGGPLLDREFVERLASKLAAEVDPPDFSEHGVWFGLAGALAVAEHFWPDESRRDRLAELARANLADPALEMMFGHPGYMALAAELHARTGEERWGEIWGAGADRLFAEWQHDEELGAWCWTQNLNGKDARYVGAAHGLLGNIHVLLRGGDLLETERRSEVEQRVVETLTSLAVVEDGFANWPTDVGDSLVDEKDGRIRVQWCHGAVGVVTTLWSVAPDDEAWTELLLAGGRLVWEAGPIRDAPGLCHGTAGNAYAFLALWRRTGDEEWLERARSFAWHALEQTDARRERLGHARHSLFTGDEGVAMCLASCIAGEAAFPIVDGLI